MTVRRRFARRKASAAEREPKASQRASGSGTTVVLAALLLLALPLAGIVLIVFAADDGLDDIELEPEPVVVAAQGRSVVEELGGSAQLLWGTAPSLVAPSWSGTVVEVPVSAGEAVESGTVVAVVDDIDRIAWHSPRPFFRRLGRNAAGGDVVEMQRLLRELGHYSGEIDGLYGGGTAAAVKAWAKTLGIAKPDGGFDPGWVVWLPDPAFEIAEIRLRPGKAAPARGEEILVGEIPLLSATAIDVEGDPFDEGPGWAAVFGGDDEVAVGPDGKLDPQQVAGLVETEAEAVEITLRRVAPGNVVVVPASAVMTNAAGDTCIWIQEGSGYSALPISIDDAKTRTVNVSGVSADAPVLANPGAVLDAPACP